MTNGLLILGLGGATAFGLTLAHKYNLLEPIGLPNPSGRWWWEPQPTNAQPLSSVQQRQIYRMIQNSKPKTPQNPGTYTLTSSANNEPRIYKPKSLS